MYFDKLKQNWKISLKNSKGQKQTFERNKKLNFIKKRINCKFCYMLCESRQLCLIIIIFICKIGTPIVFNKSYNYSRTWYYVFLFEENGTSKK